MVKAYLRYELAGSWGVIASPGSNVCYERSGRYLLTAALENVLVWNVKQAVVVSGRFAGPLMHAPWTRALARRRPSLTGMLCRR